MSSKFSAAKLGARTPKHHLLQPRLEREERARFPTSPAYYKSRSRSEKVDIVKDALRRGERPRFSYEKVKDITAKRLYPKCNPVHSLLLSRKKGAGLDPSERSEPGDRSFAKPMLNYVQIVATPTVDTPGACSLLLHFDKRRYMFGHMGEGTQRIMNQRKLAVSKVEDLFLTGTVSWATTGGLFGFILTLADVLAAAKINAAESRNKGKKHYDTHIPTALRIRASENIGFVLATARRFIFRKGLPLKVVEIRSEEQAEKNSATRAPDFEDANLKVWYMPVVPEAGEAAPKQSRKRSHDDMVSESDDNGDKKDAEETQSNRRLVESVVKNMFDSNWQLDALVESTLHQVNLPAQVFVKDKAGKVVSYEGPMPGDADHDAPDIPVLVRTPWPAANVARLPRTTPSRQSMCYIVKGQTRRGRFNPEAAIRHGVEKRKYGLLAAGQTVKGKDGADVTPDMCVAESIEGRTFAVVDLPDVSYVEPLLARPEWSEKSMMGTMDAIYWIFGRGVVHDPRIQDFMTTHKSIRHSVFGPDSSPNVLALESPAATMIKCNRIDPDRFPLPQFSNIAEHSDESRYTVARTGAKLQQAPRVIFQDEEVVPLMDTTVAFQSIPQDVLQLADAAKQKMNAPEFLAVIEEAEKDIPNRDAEVIPLGTGSSMPSKYRNVSATLVRVPGHGSYLFDCGENTLGQLRRMYGVKAIDEILCDLKVIWISHLHADHHLGTASLIRAWRDATAASGDPRIRSSRLAVASHRVMIGWLAEYADVEDYGFDRLRPISINGPATKQSVQEPTVFSPEVAKELGITRIDACRVDHCYGSLACVFTWPTGFKVAYSGDCRPSSAFAKLGLGATLLIHESTLDDELQSDARAKKHCTTSEALRIARDMQARRVLLTHFSQRYPKIPMSVQNSDAGNGVKDQVVLVAFDQMCVKIGDFKKAELFLPALKDLLEEKDEENKDEE